MAAPEKSDILTFSDTNDMRDNDNFQGRAIIENLLHFWIELLIEYRTGHALSKEEKEDLEIIDGLLHSDAPYRLWEECQCGVIRKDTIHDVEKVDEAIFKLKFKIISLSDEQRETMTRLAISCESLLVFCICNGLRKEGRLIE